MRLMKDSGVEWIGEIPNDWKTCRLKNYAHICNGTDYQGVQDDNGLYPVMGSGGEFARANDYLYDKESVLLGRKGTIDKPAYMDKPFWTVDTMYYTEVQEIGVPKYFYYLCTQIKFDYYQYGSAVPSMTQRDLNSVEFPLPSRDEQRHIADYLDRKCVAIDSVIEKQQKIIEKLKEYKLSIITEAVTKGLNPDVEMKDSGVSKIPVGWDSIKVTRLLDYSNPYPIGDGDHGLIKTEDYLPTGIPYLRVQNLGWGTDLCLDNVVYISEENNQKIKNSELHPRDVLFCKTGATIGKTGIVPESMPIANTTSHVGKITIDTKYNARFVFYYLSSHEGFEQFWNVACLKSTRPELSIEEIKDIRISMPRQRTEQDEIVEFLDRKCEQIERIIDKKGNALDRLKEYKKSLIYEVVTGKKEVPNEN